MDKNNIIPLHSQLTKYTIQSMGHPGDIAKNEHALAKSAQTFDIVLFQNTLQS